MADAIRSVRIGDQEFALDEWSHWPLYTTVEAARSTTAAPVSVSLRGFSYIVGQTVPKAGNLPQRTATVADTNQATRARINRDEAYICFAMTYEVFALETFDGSGNGTNDSDYTVAPLDQETAQPMLTGTNLRMMQMQLMLELFLGANITKPMAQAPLSWYGQSAGTWVSGSGDAVAISNGAAAAINLNYGTAGMLSADNQRRWILPVEINSDTPMYSKLSSPLGVLDVDQDWRMRQYLDGLKRRPVIA
jgi:hypothetical protein